MSEHDRREGQESARVVLQALAQRPAPSEQQTLLADAIGDLIDVSLSWNNLEPTYDRLLGFSQVLVEALQACESPPKKRPPAQCCPAWHRTFARLKAGRILA